MTLMEFLVLLVIAGVCGSIGQSLAGFTRGGCLASIGLGFVGALLGTWIARNLGLPEILAVDLGGTTVPIVWSILGSALFVAAISFFSRGKPRRSR
jgi:uncharacterized membrane protein YeaQ/YmgE (transglycosylase-associated protein family)